MFQIVLRFQVWAKPRVLTFFPNNNVELWKILVVHSDRKRLLWTIYCKSNILWQKWLCELERKIIFSLTFILLLIFILTIKSVFSIVWLYTKPTEGGWMEGQIQLRTIENNGSFENWRIYIVVDKISDRKIFIALDDFTFRLVL